jgi:hypothetical protein
MLVDGGGESVGDDAAVEDDDCEGSFHHLEAGEWERTFLADTQRLTNFLTTFGVKRRDGIVIEEGSLRWRWRESSLLAKNKFDGPRVMSDSITPDLTLANKKNNKVSRSGKPIHTQDPRSHGNKS